MRLAVIVAAVALAVAGGVAIAQDGGGTIAACTNNLRESIRFVDPGVACGTGETLITWNRQGPAGARGPQGSSGVTFARSPAAAASLQRAVRSFAKRPKKPSKKLAARLKAADPAPGEARAVFRDGPVTLPSTLAAFVSGKPQPPPSVTSLALPPGRWVVAAKVQALLDYDPKVAVVAAGATYDSVHCRLRAGADSDEAGVDGFSGTLAVQVVHRYTFPGIVQLECIGLLQPKLSDIKITAVRVSMIKNKPAG
jgi:hypothetical protein